MPIVEKRTPYRQPRQSQDSNPDSGNITVVGSELKAGKDLSLSVTQDINLVSAQNTELANDSSINPIQSVTGLL
ncbi:TPA: hemagglutinin repeat-containing protein [Proteus mirabilis]|uniref:hemagglutinin repeat-containing protein n=1 Tax=Proteus mirabilis TaxID=584 RepID=UPI0018C5D496|nr:hemagglutinin repeat-containing protein [Proteus mirabilis]MBG3117403.1 hemagglutinin repeat-containing protein [Proteus mirabilis]MDM3843346.1 hemagglutinin repeat-containing protein [Proteus mirabilis]HEK0805666.1 hemagglutinin repeat-containing protein [Proteus mirabilis]